MPSTVRVNYTALSSPLKHGTRITNVRVRLALDIYSSKICKHSMVGSCVKLTWHESPGSVSSSSSVTPPPPLPSSAPRPAPPRSCEPVRLVFNDTAPRLVPLRPRPALRRVLMLRCSSSVCCGCCAVVPRLYIWFPEYKGWIYSRTHTSLHTQHIRGFYPKSLPICR